MSTTSPRPVAESQLDRIEAKLDRILAVHERTAPWLEQLPDLLATLGNTVDDFASRDGEANFDARLRGAFELAMRVSEPRVLAALERLLDPDTLELLADIASQAPDAARAPVEERGIFGLVALLREEECQRAMSFLVQLHRATGRSLEQRNGKEVGQ